MNSRRRSPFTWRVHSRTSSPAATRNARTASQAGVSLPSRSTFIWRTVYPITLHRGMGRATSSSSSILGTDGRPERFLQALDSPDAASRHALEKTDLLLDPLSEVVPGHDHLAGRTRERLCEPRLPQHTRHALGQLVRFVWIEEQAGLAMRDQRSVARAVRRHARHPARHRLEQDLRMAFGE